MKTAQSAARALAHPLSLTCIALLLFNDHFLKAVYPSFLTGKLSDFAGIFFFPYILILLLALPAEALGLPSRRWPAAVFWFTFTWFAAVKLLEPVNDWTEQAVGLLLGGPIWIVPDATDLVALVVLLPAWKLWERISETENFKVSAFVKSAAVAAALLGTLATSPCIPPPAVTKLASFEGMLYAKYVGFRETDFEVLRSTDGGLIWNPVSDVPGEVNEELAAPQNYPENVCLRSDPRLCYRITGLNRIERSIDEGETWSVAWDIPEARRRFLEENATGCNKVPDFQVFDLLLIEDNTGAFRLFAAMGNEGLLVRARTGEWERRAIAEAEPTPLRVESLAEALTLLWDKVLLAVVIAVFTFIGLTVSLLKIAIRNDWIRLFDENEKLFKGMSVLLILAITLRIILLLLLLGFLPIPYILIEPLEFVPYGLFLAGLIHPWYLAALRSPDPTRIIVIGGLVTLTSVGGTLLGLYVLILWTFGTLQRYETALVLALAIIGLIIIASRSLIVKHLLPPPTPSQPVSM